MYFSRICAALATGAALAGCAALGPPPAPLARAPAFDLIGRVAVSYDGRAFSSGVRWEHTAARDEIWLLTPMGQALAHIVGDADGAVFTGADQSRHRSGDIEGLTRRALGWELPVARLAWWVRGDLAPDSVIQLVERDGQGRVTVLAQEGWRIEYAYPPSAGQDARPRRLEITTGEQTIRLVVDGWRQRDAAP